MPLKCCKHSTANAKYICSECGPFCQEDLKLEETKAHQYVHIDSNALRLYEICYNTAKEELKISIINAAQAKIMNLFFAEINSSNIRIEEIKHVEEKLLQAKFMIGSKNLAEYIKETIHNSCIHEMAEEINAYSKQLHESIGQLMKNSTNSTMYPTSPNKKQNEDHPLKKGSISRSRSSHELDVYNEKVSNAFMQDR